MVAFGHLGDGNLHYNLSKPESDSNTRFIESTPAVNRIVHDLVASVGARFRLNTVSGSSSATRSSATAVLTKPR